MHSFATLNRRQALAALAVAGTGPTALAQSFPSRPITLVSPYPPGGSTDITARALAPRLGAQLGQTVVVENRGGASGNIGSVHVARSAPDGHTLLVGTSATHGANVSMFKDMGYNPIKDFAPVTLAARTIIAFCVHPSLPVSNMAEFIAYVKERPGKLVYSSSGIGSPHHLAGELLNQMTGTKLVHAAYSGGGRGVSDLLAGHIPVGVLTLSNVLQHVKAGTLKLLAVTEPQRFSLVPQVPTVAETVPGYEMSAFHAILAPAATPRPIVELLSREIRKVLTSAEVSTHMVNNGFAVVASTPDELAAFLARDIPARAALVKSAGIVPE